jgi:drug/metabolite transporter (DMT)-like permease
MGSTAGNTVTPGHASARPGVWLTDASLVLMATIWGVNFSVVKYGTTLIAPLAYNGIRLMLAAVVLVAIVLIARMKLPSRRDIQALLGLGVLGNAVYQYFFVAGVERTSASDAALVIAATPAIVAIIGRMRGTERVGMRGFVGIALSIVGMGFVVLGTASGGSGDSSFSGDMLVLAGSVCWAVYTVYLKPYTARVGGIELSMVTMVGGAIPLFLVALPAISHTSWATFPMMGWAAIGYSAIGSLVIAYFLWYRGVRIIGPTRTSMYSNLQPIIAMIVAWAMLGETPTMWQILGAASIMSGLLLTRA